MLFPPTREFQDIPSSKITIASFPAQTWEVYLPQNHPIEWIDIIVNVTQTATAITNAKAGGILNIVKKLQLEFNDGRRGKRNIVSISGLALLEYCQNVYNNLDPGTLYTLIGAVGGTHAASSKHRIVYRIPFAHPQITQQPLRARFMLPAHLTAEQPKLTITTGAAADFGTGADPIAALSVEVVVKQAVISSRQQSAMAKERGAGLQNGYFAHDLIETPYTLAASLTDSEQRFAIPMPGQYTSIMARMLAYDATVGIKYSDLSAVTTSGSETIWSLEMANQVYAKWRWYHYWLEQAYAKFKGSINQTYHPDFIPAIAANTNHAYPSVIFIDRLAEGEGGEAEELSSLLDCNIPSNQGIRMDIVGKVTTPAGGNSIFSLVGHRILDNLDPFQAGRLIG